jgi:thymidylate synthase
MCLVSNYIEMMPGRLTFFLGDCHVYENHVDKFVMLQKDRPLLKMPSYGMMPNSVIDFEPVHLSLFQYNYAEAINYPFNV